MLLSIDIHSLIPEISDCEERIYFCGAGIDIEIADVIIRLSESRPNIDITIIVDIASHARRLGYGSHEAIVRLKDSGIPVFELSGARLGLCVLDNNAWVFSQLPELVEAPESGLGFNCLEVSSDQANMLAQTILNLRNKAESKDVNKSELNPEINISGFTDIEAKAIDTDKLKEISSDLSNNPPQSFDVSRQVFVFNSRLEFVELSLTGAAIERQVFKFPDAIKKLLTDDVITQKRFSASFKMIDSDSKVSSKPIASQVDLLRKRFLKSMGDLGSVMLRSHKVDFSREVTALKAKIEIYKNELASNLNKELDRSKKELVEALIDRVTQNPPDDLKYGIEGKSVSKSNARRYLETLFDEYMPSVSELIKPIELKCVYKAVTYEMLDDEHFQIQIRKKFRMVEWDKPMEEFVAAEQCFQGEIPI